MGRTSDFHGKVVTALSGLRYKFPRVPCHLQVLGEHSIVLLYFCWTMMQGQ